MNRVTLLGHLGADPVLRLTRTGTHVAQLSLATSEFFRPSGSDQEASPQERTTWHRVVVWGKQARACAQYLKKGRPVLVDGSIRAHSYVDTNKVRRLAVEVHADSVSFVGGGTRSSVDEAQGATGLEASADLGMEMGVPVESPVDSETSTEFAS